MSIAHGLSFYMLHLWYISDAFMIDDTYMMHSFDAWTKTTLFVTLLHSFLTFLDSVDLKVLFDVSLIRFGKLKVKFWYSLFSEMYLFWRFANWIESMPSNFTNVLGRNFCQMSINRFLWIYEELELVKHSIVHDCLFTYYSTKELYHWKKTHLKRYYFTYGKHSMDNFNTTKLHRFS